MEYEQLVKLRAECIANAESFLRAATLLKDQKLEHLEFHLLVLALEEIGKATIGRIAAVARSNEPDKDFVALMEDHEQKLFWAVWILPFETDKVMPTITNAKDLSKHLHEKRLASLYASPLGETTKITSEEVEGLRSAVFSRLEMERSDTLQPLSDKSLSNISWFFKATQDKNKARIVFSRGSLDKFSELKEPAQWLAWLKEQFETQERESAEILEAELTRQMPTGREAFTPKWKARLRLYSQSHSIRPKAFREWNKGLKQFQLQSVNGHKDQILVEFGFPKAVGVTQLTDAIRFMSSLFAVAINVGTQGLFWWNFSPLIKRIQDSLEDVEREAIVGMEDGPLRLQWPNQALDSRMMQRTAIALTFLMANDKLLRSFVRTYSVGLDLMAKSDLYVSLLPNALLAFYDSLRAILTQMGSMTSDGSVVDGLTAELAKISNPPTDVLEVVALAEAIKKSPGDAHMVTISQCMTLRTITDAVVLMRAGGFMKVEYLKRAESDPPSI